MAYVSQELKAKLAPKIKALLKKYGLKGSLAVRNNSTLVLNIKSGKIDFLESFNRLGAAEFRPAYNQFHPATKCIDVNPYHYQDHFDGKAKEFLTKVIPAMNVGNFDKSDIQTDYFHVGWYIGVNIGKWNKPYEVTA